MIPRSPSLCSLACLLLLALQGVPGSAQTDPGQARLHEAIALHNEGRFDEAARLLEAARPQARSSSVRARICLELGINYAILGRTELARSAFAAALTQDPSLEIDAEVVKKPVVALFRAERARLRGELRVSSSEHGATVTVDGERAGRCPLVLRLPVGVHRVEVWDGEGRRLVHRQLVLAAGQVLQVVGGRGQPRAAAPSTPAASSAPAPQAATRTEPGRRRSRIWAWALAGGSLAAAGTALGLWLWGRSGYDEYLHTVDHSRFLELQDSVPRRYIAADVMVGVAAGLAVTSVVIFVLEGRQRAAEPRAARLVPLGGAGLGAALRGTF
jgi:hypothetical protein